MRRVQQIKNGYLIDDEMIVRPLEMDRGDLVSLDCMLGISYGYETFRETCIRMKRLGEYEMACLYGDMERRWFEGE